METIMFDYLEPFALALIPTFIVIDLLFRPARKYEYPRFWRVNGLAITVLAVFLSFEVAAFWDGIFAGVKLIDGSGLGPWLGAVVGIFVYELAHYAYHRSVHRFKWLWRFNHQMHHSAESLDPFGAYFLHPLDVFCFTSISSLVLFPVLGLSFEAVLLVNVWLIFNAMFQHANVKTPRWLGYVIQRPESHAIHHARGVHRHNYADLPVIDMLFGTFRNPRTADNPVGFYDGASNRWFEMAIGQDVCEPLVFVTPVSEQSMTARGEAAA
jgi:sterol desaturase/sphingolipid hydroxylase (fatty acid hydroxylase superfamily)